MHSREEFEQMVGQVISLMQTVEFDVKWIYSAMMQGPLMENHQIVDSWTFGATIKALQQLDESDNTPFFKTEDYRLLRHVNHSRNDIVHHIFVRFLYTEKKYESPEYEQVDREVTQFHEELKTLSLQMERKRFEIFKYYGRM
jgi:mRNA-degrading endonuclease HigB of HigAB toxin-antitoxin module